MTPFNSGPSLVVISDTGRARHIPVPFDGIVLGRDARLGPPFSTDEFVSRNHVSVRRRGGGVEIADLGSANGTYVNGARVHAPARLEDSDVLRIGEIELKLAAPGGADQTMTAVEAARANEAMPYLTVLTPDALSGRQFQLPREHQVVGRTPTCDICLDDPHVSRTHAALRRRGDAVYVEDLGSSSGTFVNGQAVTALWRASRCGNPFPFVG